MPLFFSHLKQQTTMGFIKNLKARIVAEETKFGKFLKGALASILAVLAACAMVAEQVSLLPDGFVDPIVKKVLGIAAVVSFVAGKLTKKTLDSSPNTP